MTTFPLTGLPLGTGGDTATSHPSRTVTVGPILVVAATCFNLLLCYANTKHLLAVGAAEVAAISLAILAAGLGAARDLVTPSLTRIAGVVAVAVVGLKLFNPALDLKILFDLAIPPVFFLLGKQSSPRAAERMLTLLMVIVLVVGLAELYLTELFQRELDILAFYTSKGAVNADAVNYNGSTFFASAERDGDMGRLLLPFLGPHRVSSIFLEPISLGNFSLICLAWLLCVRRNWTAVRRFLAFGTALCVVLPDSRQAAATCVMMAALRALPLHRSRVLAAALPLCVLTALVVAGFILHEPGQAIGFQSDDFRGRLLFSGELLASFDAAEWLALDNSPIYTADTGYAYLINAIGLPLAIMLAAGFASAGSRGGPGASMRGMLAIYIATSLSIGASMFSIKTAALAWFLFGVTQTIQTRADGRAV